MWAVAPPIVCACVTHPQTIKVVKKKTHLGLPNSVEVRGKVGLRSDRIGTPVCNRVRGRRVRNRELVVHTSAPWGYLVWALRGLPASRRWHMTCPRPPSCAYRYTGRCLRELPASLFRPRLGASVTCLRLVGNEPQIDHEERKDFFTSFLSREEAYQLIQRLVPDAK